MSIKAHLTEKLSKALTLKHIEVINESHLHNVPTGSESHFKVVLVSDEFANRPLVKRHQLVYSVLKEELEQQIHALALHTFTLSEWQKIKGSAPTTPDCQKR